MNSEKGVTLDYQDEDSQFNEELIQEDSQNTPKYTKAPVEKGAGSESKQKQ